MLKKQIITEVTPLLERAVADISETDILENKKNINRAIALFTQELVDCSKVGQVVIDPKRYGELLMDSLTIKDYAHYLNGVELLQWHMLEQSPHTGFLWAMTVFLDRVNALSLFESILDMEIINAALKEISDAAFEEMLEERRSCRTGIKD